MGEVTNVEWECPECGKKNIAQVYGDCYCPNDSEYKTLPRNAIPSNTELKWNPPCKGCGKYKLIDPPVTLVEFPIARVSKEDC